MENEENQNQVSLRFPPPLEIAPRFPQSHNPDDDSPLPKTQNQKARKEPQRLKKPQPPSSGSSFDEKMLQPRSTDTSPFIRRSHRPEGVGPHSLTVLLPNVQTFPQLLWPPLISAGLDGHYPIGSPKSLQISVFCRSHSVTRSGAGERNRSQPLTGAASPGFFPAT